jgi:hypothetical protein
MDFHVRAALIDRDLKILELLKPSENEFDVVATFKNACPRLVLKTEGATYVPLDAVAHVVEVKQTLEMPGLKSDLDKLNVLDKVAAQFSFGSFFHGDWTVMRPLKILFYYEAAIDTGSMIALLSQRSGWDMLAVFRDDLLLGNRSLPAFQRMKGNPSAENIAAIHPNALIQMLLVAAASMPSPPTVSTLQVFLGLLRIFRE